MTFRIIVCSRCFFTTAPRGHSVNLLTVALLPAMHYTQDGMPDRVKIR
jgi:hypothetical protein